MGSSKTNKQAELHSGLVSFLECTRVSLTVGVAS